ncbi:hypothetical protein ES703_28681 [subsurface metagenome]
MPRQTKDDWTAWHEEIRRYAQRETQGLSADLKALEQHIAKLREVCPKDRAEYPHLTALIYLNRLQIRLDEVKSYLAIAA